MTVKELLLKQIPGTPLKKQIIAGGINGLFVFLILWIFQPFGTYEYTIAFKTLFLLGYGVITSASYSLFFIAGFTFFPQWFSDSGWKIYKEVICFILVFNIMAFLCLIYHREFTGKYPLTFSEYFNFLQYVFLVGLFPFSVLYYQRWLAENLSGRDLKTIESTDSQEPILIYSNNKKEPPAKVTEKEILFIKSEGNYLEIISEKNGALQKQVIRNTLNNILSSLPDHLFCKVHRSYIINKKRVTGIRLDGSNYELMTDFEKMTIPV